MAGKKPVVPSSGSVQPSTGAPTTLPVFTQELKARWVAALRGGEYDQGKEALCIEGKYCCLGVLNDLANLGIPGECGYLSDMDATGKVPLDREFAIGENMGLPVSVQRKLAQLNDDGEGFLSIADYIEANVPAVTVADVPGLSTADQTDEAVTSHQTEVE